MGDALWQKVKEAGKEFNIAPIAPNLIRCIEGGMLSYVSDIRRQDCPYTIGLDRLADIDQSTEFIGKQALKKIKQEGPKNKLVGLEIGGIELNSPPESPWPVLINGKSIGTVSRCIFSPWLNNYIGFALVCSNHSALGTFVEVQAPHGIIEAQVSAFPWFKAERITRH